VVGKGNKLLNLQMIPAEKDHILQNVLGRSGNLRAPTLQVGTTYYVGYNEAMYQELTT
jgi:hypothetical protein